MFRFNVHRTYAERIIVTVDLVCGIVTSGAVRRAHQQVDLFPIEHFAFDLQSDVADDDDGAFGACHLHREVHDGVRLGGGGDERPIHAPPAGRIADHRLEALGIARAVLHAQAARAIHSSGIQIEADDVAAGRAQELRGNLPDEAQTEHRDSFPELRRRPAHALERNGADRRRRPEAHGAKRRNAAHEIAFDRHVVGMVCLPRARARHEIARRQVVDSLADRDDFAGGRIADAPSLFAELARRQAADSLRRRADVDRFERHTGSSGGTGRRHDHRHGTRAFRIDNQRVFERASFIRARAKPGVPAFVQHADRNHAIVDAPAHADDRQLIVGQCNRLRHDLVAGGRLIRDQ